MARFRKNYGKRGRGKNRSARKSYGRKRKSGKKIYSYRISRGGIRL